MKKQTKKHKRLVVNLSEDQHHAVKSRALKKKLTIREWVSLAITELIRKEMIEEI